MWRFRSSSVYLGDRFHSLSWGGLFSSPSFKINPQNMERSSAAPSPCGKERPLRTALGSPHLLGDKGEGACQRLMHPFKVQTHFRAGGSTLR